MLLYVPSLVAKTKTLPVDKNMDVFRVVQRLRLTPDDRKGCCNVGNSEKRTKFNIKSQLKYRPISENIQVTNN